MNYYSATVWEGSAARCYEPKSVYAECEASYQIACTLHTAQPFSPMAEALLLSLWALLEQPLKNSMEIQFLLN